MGRDTDLLPDGSSVAGWVDQSPKKEMQVSCRTRKWLMVITVPTVPVLHEQKSHRQRSAAMSLLRTSTVLHTCLAVPLLVQASALKQSESEFSLFPVHFIKRVTRYCVLLSITKPTSAPGATGAKNSPVWHMLF